LSTPNGEIFLQKYPPISGKLSITIYFKQNAITYQSHLTIENNLKVKKWVFRKTSTTLSPHIKTFGATWWSPAQGYSHLGWVREPHCFIRAGAGRLRVELAAGARRARDEKFFVRVNEC